MTSRLENIPFVKSGVSTNKSGGKPHAMLKQQYHRAEKRSRRSLASTLETYTNATQGCATNFGSATSTKAIFAKKSEKSHHRMQQNFAAVGAGVHSEKH